MFGEILVATDGSEAATAAVERAADFARRFGAGLHVLYVVERSLYGFGGERGEVTDEGTAVLDAAVEVAEGAGVDVVETAYREGRPHEAVAAYTTDPGVDLVVMGSSGRGGIGRRLLGSTTGRVVRTVDVPVLTVHEGEGAGTIERVVHPTDGSAASDAALPYAVQLAIEYGAGLRALSVVDMRAYGLGDSLSGVLPEMVEHHQAATDRIAEYAADHGVECETAVVRGIPHDDIVDDAVEHDVDMIVMGTHGATGVEHALLGSVAEKVLRRAPVPVLVVPADPGS